jgi:serine protease inhibitor
MPTMKALNLPTPEAHDSTIFLIDGSNRFAFDLYHQIKSKKGNLFFSPYGIFSAFAMTASGARGDTINEMQTVLHYSTALSSLVGNLTGRISSESLDPKNPTQFILANTLWIPQDAPILPIFQSVVKRDFKEATENIDFTIGPLIAVRRINQGVSNQTRGRISQVLNSQDVNAESSLVLTSAAYLKAQWAQMFDSKATALAPFKTGPNSTLQAQMMKTSGSYSMYQNDDLFILELPFAPSVENGPQLAMVIFLPNIHSSIDQLEKSWTQQEWVGWHNEMKEQQMNVTLPKFRIEDRLDLNQTMIDLGMVKPFNSEANFAGMSPKQGLFISRAIHKTFIRLDEKGTEAASAYGVILRDKAPAISGQLFEFVVDRPFLFLIVERRTQSILFMGRVMQP